MKAQAINIDWVVGLSLFLSATVGAAFAALTPGAGLLEQSDRLGQRAETLNEQLVDETSRNFYRNSIHVRGPSAGRVAFKTDYAFDERAENRSGTINTVGEVNVSRREIYAAPGTGNRSYSFGYFSSNVSNQSLGGHLETGSGWANNSDIAVEASAPGLVSLRVNGTETLDGSADLDSSDYSFDGNPVRASALSGDVTVLSNTSEIIVEDLDGARFEFGNFSSIFWEEDNSTNSIGAAGDVRSGGTEGLTLYGLEGSSVAVTITGNLSADVDELPNDNVEAELDAEKLKLRLHENGLDAGFSRVKFRRNGFVVIGAERVLRTSYRKDINSLSALDDQEFEDRYDLELASFNVSFGGSWGSEIPFDEVTVRSSKVSTVNRSGKIYLTDLRTALWE